MNVLMKIQMEEIMNKNISDKSLFYAFLVVLALVLLSKIPVLDFIIEVITLVFTFIMLYIMIYITLLDNKNKKKKHGK